MGKSHMNLEISEVELAILSLLAEVKARQGYDGTSGQGTIDVTNGSADVFGTETIFSQESDIGRSIQQQTVRLDGLVYSDLRVRENEV